MLAALVGLVAATRTVQAAALDDGQQNYNTQLQLEQQQHSWQQQARYLRVDNVTVINGETMAVGAFYLGTIALGFMSVLNDAAIKVAKHRASKASMRKKYKAKTAEDYDVDENANHEQGSTLQYDKYEEELRQYRKEYDEYLRKYREWAEAYGQDPVPPASEQALVSKR